VPRQCCESLFSAPGVFFLAIFDLDPAKLSSIDVLFRASRNHRANEEHQNCRRYGNQNADNDINEHLSRSPMCLFCNVGDFNLLRSASRSDSKRGPSKVNNPVESPQYLEIKTTAETRNKPKTPRTGSSPLQNLNRNACPDAKLGEGQNGLPWPHPSFGFNQATVV
jgi:hypothetical protein